MQHSGTAVLCCCPAPLQPCGTTVLLCRPPRSPVAQQYCAAAPLAALWHSSTAVLLHPLQPCGTTVLHCRPPCSPVAQLYCAAANLAALWHSSTVVLLQPLQPCGTVVYINFTQQYWHCRPPCLQPCGTTVLRCRTPCSPVAQLYCAAAPHAAQWHSCTMLLPPCSPVAQLYCSAAHLAALWHNSTALLPPLQPCGTNVMRCRQPCCPVAQQYCSAAAPLQPCGTVLRINFTRQYRHCRPPCLQPCTLCHSSAAAATHLAALWHNSTALPPPL
jgi:hypothetical protein